MKKSEEKVDSMMSIIYGKEKIEKEIEVDQGKKSRR